MKTYMSKFEQKYKLILQQYGLDRVQQKPQVSGVTDRQTWTSQKINYAFGQFQIWPELQKQFILNYTKPLYTKTGRIAKNSFLLNQAGLDFCGKRVKPTTPFKLYQDVATFSQYGIVAHETIIFAVSIKTDWRTEVAREVGGNNYYLVEYEKLTKKGQYYIKLV